MTIELKLRRAGDREPSVSTSIIYDENECFSEEALECIALGAIKHLYPYLSTATRHKFEELIPDNI